MKRKTTLKTILNRLCAIALAFGMVASLLPAGVLQVPVEAASGDWIDDGNYSASLSGTGTPEDPYLVASAADLAKISKDASTSNGLTGYYKLTADIDLSAHYWTGFWKFSGTLDGNGHKITGLQIGTATSPVANNYGGLVQQLTGGTVKNLTVDVGIYMENASKLVEVGGIAGRMTGGTIDNCTVTGVISGFGSANHTLAGGIAGRVNGTPATIKNCTNEASVTAGSAEGILAYASGILGRAESNNTVTIANCANYGHSAVTTGYSVTEGNKTTYSAVAGICAINGAKISLSNCLDLGTRANADGAKGTRGAYYISGSIASNQVYVTNGTGYKNFADSNETYANASALVTALKANATTGGWKSWGIAPSGKIIIGATSWNERTSEPVKVGDVYQITSGAELAWLIKNGSGTAKIMKDIDLSDYFWVPCNYTGSLDGNGYQITGLQIGTSESRAQYQYAGLVGVLSSPGVIKNVSVDVRLYITDNNSSQVEAGGIAGRVHGGSVDNCTVTGVIDGFSDKTFMVAGGIVGRVHSNGGTITNCTNKANVTGTSSGVYVNVSGIAGQLNGTTTITNCVNHGAIHGETTYSDSKSFSAGICVNGNVKTLTLTNVLNVGAITINGPEGKAETSNHSASGSSATTYNYVYYYNGEDYVMRGSETPITSDLAMVLELNKNVTGSMQTWIVDAQNDIVSKKDVAEIASAGKNVRLQDLLKIGFYFKLDGTTAASNVGALVWAKDAYLTGEAKEYKNLTATGGTYCVETDGIYAQNIDDAYVLVPYYVDADGAYVYGDAVEYSVLDYCKAVYNMTDNDWTDSNHTLADTKQIVIDLVNYATAASAYFEENLAHNSFLADGEKTVAWTENMNVAEHPANSEAALTATYHGRNINLLDAISLGMYFTNHESITKVVYLDSEKTAEQDAEAETLGSYKKVKVAGVYADNIYDNYYIRVYEGDTYADYGFNVAAYLTDLMERDDSSDTLIALCKAMQVYGTSAKTYFN